MARLNHLIEVVEEDARKLMKWAWVRIAILAFFTTFATSLLITDQPISKNLILSAIVAGLGAAYKAINPTIPMSVLEQHFNEAHTAAQLDWKPDDYMNKPIVPPPAHPLGEPPPPDTPASTPPANAGS